MKKIVFLILTLLCMSFVFPINIGCRVSLNNTECPSTLRYLIPDSLMQILKERTFLIYWYGHHGHVWSLIYREDISYRICIGSTREIKNKQVETIDTIELLNDYNTLIQWGMDSLPVLAENMTPCHEEYSSWLYRSLDVYHSNKEVFTSKNVKYSGPDSIAFNQKLGELCYLMWWLSDPNIRQYLPGFEKYSYSDTNVIYQGALPAKLLNSQAESLCSLN